ncbi:sulfotransferase 1C2-like [Bradysia coprophila]|uniref:sulfotransferase 1C2-like n=1 Tax=Bradysia coprophila TaxID=38358 RepID=UPI00187D7D4A|nr:sulfotransferase 1C2-like [Bradysia coprophila]
MAAHLQYRVVNGLKFAPGFSFETCLSALNYKPLDDDIFIVTYPKNGTTWTQQIVILLQNNGTLPDDVAKGDMSLRSPFLEYRGTESLKQLTRPYSIKTHIEGNSHPWNPHAKYIIVLRNPKDALVSFYYHQTSSPHYGIPDLPFDDFFELFMDGEVECGSYFDWVLSWWQRKDFDNVMITTYESRMKDPAGDVTQIAKFLDIVYDDDIIKRTVEMSSFGAMRETMNEWKKSNFLRKGIVGDWRTHLNNDQNKRLQNMFHQKFDGTGLETLWNDSM